MKRQLGRGHKNVSSRRESFVPVIICRGRARAINANCEHKGRRNSTKLQLCSRYLKRYSAFAILDAPLHFYYISSSRDATPVFALSGTDQVGGCKLFFFLKNFPQCKFTKLSSSKETVFSSCASSISLIILMPFY